MSILKFLWGLIESIIKSSAILLLIAMILLLSSDSINKSDYRFLAEVIAIALFGVFYVYQVYADIKNKQYITYPYIIVADLVILLSFSLICYLNYKHYDSTDAIITGHSYIRWCVIMIGLVDLIRNKLKSEKYIKNDL